MKKIFPWRDYDIGRLHSLGLPDLAGKRVLDLSCGSACICAWAIYSKAKSVCGLDADKAQVALAKQLLPEGTFICAPWHEFPKDTYDIIVSPYNIDHGPDLEKNIAMLMDHVAPTGMLALEVVITKKESPTGTGFTRKLMQEILANYAFRLVPCNHDPAVDQELAAYRVFHKRPYAMLFMSPPNSGKTSLAQTINIDKASYIHGDLLLRHIQLGKESASAELGALLQADRDNTNLTVAINKICEAGMLEQYLQAIDRIANKQSFVFDGFIP